MTPVIAPVLRASTVVNTEHLKKSVYLKKKKEATGTALHTKYACLKVILWNEKLMHKKEQTEMLLYPTVIKQHW